MNMFDCFMYDHKAAATHCKVDGEYLFSQFWHSCVDPRSDDYDNLDGLIIFADHTSSHRSC